MTINGYVRVSTADQDEGRQVEKMKALQVDRVFIDKASGKNMQRPQYQALRALLKHGDVMYIDSIDRLGRNYEAVCNEWRYITRDVGADIIALDLDFMNSKGFREMGSVGVLLEDTILGLLAWVAQSEREKIKQRQKEGIALAKAEGVYKGRALDHEKVAAALQLSQKDAERMLGVSKSTYYRWKREA